MAAHHFILLVESDSGQTDTLATQLVRLGIEPIRVADLGEAIETIKAREYSICGVALPSHLPGKAVHKAMQSIRRREPMLPALVYGKQADAAHRKLLQKAGVLLALWDGYDEGMLRFQVNRLTSSETQSMNRRCKRAPIHAQVRVLQGGREKQGTLYSIAEGGCFIETPRASMDGARLHVVFTIDSTSYALDGAVAFSNVPGNLQRPNLPLGMGVRFDEAPEEVRAELARFVQERMALLEV